MQITYRFKADLAFFRTGLRRCRRQRPNRLRNNAASAVAILALAGSWLYARFTDAPWVGIPESAAIGALVGAVAVLILGRVLLPIRLKKTPGFGAEVTTVIDDSGLLASGLHEQAKLEWAGITRAVRFADGIMLIRGRVFRWLPDAALQDSTPSEDPAFVPSKTDLIAYPALSA
jgi:hypothetical protein